VSSPSSAPQPTQSKLPSFGFTYLPLVTDFAMRYAILGLWRTSIISSTWFWVGQAIVIPTGIFTWTQVRETALKKRLNIPDNVRIEPKDAAHWILFMFLLMVHGGFQIFTRLSLSPPGFRF
jgi:polyferredoxin